MPLKTNKCCCDLPVDTGTGTGTATSTGTVIQTLNCEYDTEDYAVCYEFSISGLDGNHASCANGNGDWVLEYNEPRQYKAAAKDCDDPTIGGNCCWTSEVWYRTFVNIFSPPLYCGTNYDEWGISWFMTANAVNQTATVTALVLNASNQPYSWSSGLGNFNVFGTTTLTLSLGPDLCCDIAPTTTTLTAINCP